MKKAITSLLACLLACLTLILALNSQAFAHTLFMTVEDNEGRTV